MSLATPEPAFRRWSRRALTVPLFVGGFFLALPFAPLTLLGAALFDLLRRRPTLPTARLLAFLLSYLFTETVGLFQLLALWILCLGRPSALERHTWPIQRRYVAMHFFFAEWIYRLSFEVEGDDLVGRGPLLVLIRHASLVDTMLPGIFLANRHLLELRYVLKKELLLDPCLDIAGHWLPNHFVARDGSDSGKEIDAVRRLKHGLAENQGVLIYPEGTRFSKGKRARSLERLKDDPEAHARASKLVHLLLPKPGGVLALLDASPACDVLFVGHSGLEGFSSFDEICNGSLVGRPIKLRFWREPAASIPKGRDAQLAWLQDHWERMDAWLATTEPDQLGAPG